jgi:hypothetical protein
MTRWSKSPPAIVGLMIAGLIATTVPGSAQRRCPEGKTFSGACVKPDLAEAMRKQTFAYTQPKFSYTAPPQLPSEDGAYYVPRDYNELRTIFGGGSSAPSCTPVTSRFGTICQ